jgi:hypothetical protein
MTGALRLDVPPAFYSDHRSRDLPEEGGSLEVGRRGRSLIVEMDEAAFRDLYSDALYYSDSGIAADMGLPGLAASARATVRALRRQAPSLTNAIDNERRERGWL